MKVEISKNKTKKFTPIELSVIIESQKELDDIIIDSDHLSFIADLEQSTMDLLQNIGNKLKSFQK